jgi:hypothetical protein
MQIFYYSQGMETKSYVDNVRTAMIFSLIFETLGREPYIPTYLTFRSAGRCMDKPLNRPWPRHSLLSQGSHFVVVLVSLLYLKVLFLMHR